MKDGGIQNKYSEATQLFLHKLCMINQFYLCCKVSIFSKKPGWLVTSITFAVSTIFNIDSCSHTDLNLLNVTHQKNK